MNHYFLIHVEMKTAALEFPMDNCCAALDAAYGVAVEHPNMIGEPMVMEVVANAELVHATLRIELDRDMDAIDLAMEAKCTYHRNPEVLVIKERAEVWEG